MSLLPWKGGTVLPALTSRYTPNKSQRTSAIDLVVLHDTEGGYAGAVSWLRNRSAQASAHIVLSEDGKQATQLVPYSEKAWACAAFNSRSLNLEMAGYASKGFPIGQLRVAARIVAFWCKRYDIPARNARGGARSGVTFHQDLGAAGGGHHDPGFSAARKWAFILLVKHEVRRGGFRKTWGEA